MNNQLKWAVFYLFPIFIFSCNEKAGDRGIATAIANANGAKEFSKIKSIEFTFNADKDSAHTERHWKWMPKENSVIFYDKNDSVLFKRMDTSSAELKNLNARFTNDEYWLIFPLHLQWDGGYTITDNDTATGPVTEKRYHKYTVQYSGKEGFTPGDMYELYTDDNNMIQEWAFHRSAAKEPTIMTSWENYENFNGLKIAKEHKSKDGKFRLYFTGVTVLQ
ncbi:MAG: hypothetical protein H7Z13_00395 [Ferruginibacter sp.]|nr:hypothetical protein [Ferruginibacter sp.]